MPGIGDSGPDAPLPVAWDEARELVAIVLLVVGVMRVLGPIVQVVGVDGRGDFWSKVLEGLRNVNATSGMLFLASALLVCTVPPVDVVPALRSAVTYVAAVVTILGVVSLVALFAVPIANDGDEFWIRLEFMMSRTVPAIVLAGTAAWLARRVVPFPD